MVQDESGLLLGQILDTADIMSEKTKRPARHGRALPEGLYAVYEPHTVGSTAKFNLLKTLGKIVGGEG